MKFAHLADCHLGSWNVPELRELSSQSFQFAIDTCIKENVDFVLIAGDLFDSAYPSIDILKQAFEEFRKLKEAKIPVFLIAGSHDYSVSGKTFLEVLEKAGFCKNVFIYEEKNEKIILQPTIYKGCAIYGFPGKKSSLEVEDIERIKLEDAPGLFKILMLHTAIRDATPNLESIKAVDEKKLPKVDYLALGHLHIKYTKENRVYAGPTFPNNLSEIEELKGGSFFIFEDGKLERKEMKLKEIYVLNLEILNTTNTTENMLSSLERENLKDKIVIVKLFGILNQGKISDIDFKKIEELARKKGAFAFLKSTTKLLLPDPEIKLSSLIEENLEDAILKSFEEKNQSKFNILIRPLIDSLQVEKLDDEKSSIFEERLLSETKKVLRI
tara:strand:- start:9926 stop:11077 length:1152 start_codon:yes stop_codon:yes gene_type:complete